MSVSMARWTWTRIIAARWPGGMPSFATQLSDEQIWDLVNYLRSIERR